jgi:hypothetical protein
MSYFLIKPTQTVETIQDYFIGLLQSYITEITPSGSESHTEATPSQSTSYKERLSEFPFHQINDEYEFTTTASLSSSPSSFVTESESVERVDIHESDISASPSRLFFAEKPTAFQQISSQKNETKAEGTFLGF